MLACLDLWTYPVFFVSGCRSCLAYFFALKRFTMRCLQLIDCRSFQNVWREKECHKVIIYE